MLEPVVETKIVKTVIRSLDLTEQEVIRIIRQYVKNQYDFSDRCIAMPGEYFSEGMSVTEKIETTQVEKPTT